MAELQFENIVPTVQAVPALDEVLRGALGDAYAGLSTVKGLLIVTLTDTATPDDSNAARLLVLSHDFTKRTDAQIEAETAKTAFEAVVGADAQDDILAAMQSDLDQLSTISSIAGMKTVLQNMMDRNMTIIKAMRHFQNIAGG